MPELCSAPLCNHRGKDCKLFRFPSSLSKSRKWAQLVRRKDRLPNFASRLCSCHFPNGSRNNLPTIFEWNIRKRLTFTSPEKRRRKNKSFGKDEKVEETEERTFFTQQGNDPSTVPETEDSACISSPSTVPEAEESSCISNPSAVSEREESACISREDAKIISLSCEVSRLREELKNVNAEKEENQKKFQEEIEKIKWEKTIVISEILGDVSSLQRDLKKIKEENEQEKSMLLKEIERIKQEHAETKRKYEIALRRGDVSARSENYFLRKRLAKIEKRQENERAAFSFDEISHSEELVSHYTGLPNAATFEAVVGLFDGISIKYYHGWRVEKLTVKNQIFFTLVKLRRNLSNLDLSGRFKVSDTTVSNVVLTWLDALHFILIRADNSLLCKVPSRFKNQKDMPSCFRDYPNTRIIIDCTEVRTADPKLLSKHNKVYSSYKHYITGKGLIGIAPNGTVTFVSKLYPGRTSDKEIVVDCKILDCLEPGDAVMADKGFLIAPLLPPGVVVNIPPFKETPQFTREQIDQTYGIAQARIHVERAIQRVKLYRILDFIPHPYLQVASKIFQVSAALTNFIRDTLSSFPDNVQPQE